MEETHSFSLTHSLTHSEQKSGLQKKLRFGVDAKVADNICCHNRHYAEHSGYAMSKKTTVCLLRLSPSLFLFLPFFP